MTYRLPCDECEAILDELRHAAGYSGTPERLRNAIGATLPVILSADDDALDDLLEKYPYRLPLRGSAEALQQPSPQASEFQVVFRHLWAHRARTGRWPLPHR